MTSRWENGRPIIVLNPRSGSQPDADTATEVRKLFNDHAVRPEILVVRGNGDWVSDVRSRAADAPAVIAAGGDGTVNLVASALAGTSTPLGILPLGTRNHFARDLRLALDLPKAVETIAAGHTIPVDLGQVNDRIFVNNCSFGVYPMIVHVRDELRKQGYSKWFAFLIAAKAVLERHPELRVRLATDRDDEICRTPFVLVGNNAYDVAGLRMTGRTSLQAGQLFAYLAPDAPPHTLPQRIFREALARALARYRTPTAAFRVISGDEIWIDAGGPRRVRIAVDGEVANTTLPLRCRIRPRALSVFAPPVEEQEALSVAS